MASSTLDPDAGTGPGAVVPPGHDVGSLGPSDLSDTGSDSLGPSGYDRSIRESDGDSVGTGVDPSPLESNVDDPGEDIGFDRIVDASEAGLGGGLDQAEEALAGVTDEDLDPVDEAGASLDPDAGPPRGRDDTPLTELESPGRLGGWGRPPGADRVDPEDGTAPDATGPGAGEDDLS